MITGAIIGAVVWASMAVAVACYVGSRGQRFSPNYSGLILFAGIGALVALAL